MVKYTRERERESGEFKDESQIYKRERESGEFKDQSLARYTRESMAKYIK